MRNGILISLFIVFFSASSYAEEKMICYIPKKPAPKPVAPVKPVNKEIQAKLVTNDNNNIVSDLTSQNTQVLISYPLNSNEGKSRDSKEETGFAFEATKYILDFIVKIISILAWPVVLILTVGRFKEEIKNLAKRVAKANVAGMGFEFHDIADKYEDVDGTVTPEQEIKSDLDPRGTIISAWLNIETKLYQIFEANKEKVRTLESNSFRQRPPIFQIVRFLRDKKLLDQDDVEILADLRKMRNRVAHESDLKLTQDDVTKYLILANYAEVSLEKIENQLL